jgi:HEAT repeat protein
MWSLGNIKASQAVDQLIMLSKPSGFFHKSMPVEIRIEVVNALAMIGGGRAIKALKRLSKRRNDTVGEAAKNALEKNISKVEGSEE